MSIKKRAGLPTSNSSKTSCNTKDIIINFRVTVEQWQHLLKKSGGKGKLSRYIRHKLGLKNELEGSG